MKTYAEQVTELISLGLYEDIGSGDITSLYFVPETRMATAFVRVRESGIISGADIAEQVFRTVNPQLQIVSFLSCGSKVVKDEVILKVTGSARSILTAERTALNMMQHLSGIASLTSLYLEQTMHTNAQILDTRKTLPAYRLLEKKAVRDGGGTNHRMGLYDRAMVKDNHLMTEGDIPSLQNVIYKLKREKPGIDVELEADRLDQVERFLSLEGVDYILLDNMSLDELRSAVQIRGNGKVKLEASGGVNLDTVKAIAETGVDFISVGALTHSAPALDIGLDFETIQ